MTLMVFCPVIFLVFLSNLVFFTSSPRFYLGLDWIGFYWDEWRKQPFLQMLPFFLDVGWGRVWPWGVWGCCVWGCRPHPGEGFTCLGMQDTIGGRGGMVMSRALRDISAVQDVAGRGKTTKTCDQGSQKIWEGIGLVLGPQILFSV